MFLGFFAAAWFGWAQASPPEWLRLWLAVGSTIGWLVALVGAIVGFRSLRERTLYPLGVALCAVAVAGLIAGVTSAGSPSTIVGVSAGLLLFAYAVTSLIRAFVTADPHMIT